jgi:hypothetical protein
MVHCSQLILHLDGLFLILKHLQLQGGQCSQITLHLELQWGQCSQITLHLDLSLETLEGDLLVQPGKAQQALGRFLWAVAIQVGLPMGSQGAPVDWQVPPMVDLAVMPGEIGNSGKQTGMPLKLQLQRLGTTGPTIVEGMELMKGECC